MAKSKPHGTSGVLSVPQNVSAEHARLGAIERRPEGVETQMSSVAEVGSVRLSGCRRRNKKPNDCW